jgi:hypothetical protein
LAKFRQIQLEILNGTSKKYPIRRVSFRDIASGGYGNKMYALLGSMAISILVDAALIIRWDHYMNFIEEPYPFPGSYADYSKRNDTFNIEWNKEEIFHTSDGGYLFEPKPMHLLVKTEIDIRNHSRFRSAHSLIFGVCTNPIYYDKLLDYGLVSNQTVKNARRVAFNMQNYTVDEQAFKLFQVSFEVAGNLLNKAWIPIKKIRDMVMQILVNEFEGNYVIGIQLRLES